MLRTSRVLRQAAVHAERTPLIKFVGPRTIPGKFFSLSDWPSLVNWYKSRHSNMISSPLANVDHTPKPHPASPLGKLPESWAGYGNGAAASSHASFSTYRDHAQQHGPLQKSVRSDGGIGGTSGANLGAVEAPQGVFFDASGLPTRFQRRALTAAEIDAIESGGAAMFS